MFEKNECNGYGDEKSYDAAGSHYRMDNAARSMAFPIGISGNGKSKICYRT